MVHMFLSEMQYDILYNIKIVEINDNLDYNYNYIELWINFLCVFKEKKKCSSKEFWLKNTTLTTINSIPVAYLQV